MRLLNGVAPCRAVVAGIGMGGEGIGYTSGEVRTPMFVGVQAPRYWDREQREWRIVYVDKFNRIGARNIHAVFGH